MNQNTASYGFVADDISRFLPDRERSEVLRAFKSGDRVEIARIMDEIGHETRARMSIIPFPEPQHTNGQYMPSRDIGIATQYLGSQLPRALNEDESEFSLQDVGLFAFGAAIKIIDGLIAHVESQQVSA